MFNSVITECTKGLHLKNSYIILYNCESKLKGRLLTFNNGPLIENKNHSGSHLQNQSKPFSLQFSKKIPQKKNLTSNEQKVMYGRVKTRIVLLNLDLRVRTH